MECVESKWSGARDDFKKIIQGDRFTVEYNEDVWSIFTVDTIEMSGMKVITGNKVKSSKTLED